MGSGAEDGAILATARTTQLKMMVATKRGRYLGTYVRVEPVVQPASEIVGRFLPCFGCTTGDEERGDGT